MADEYRIIIIDEENGELLTNQVVDEEDGERLAAIVENGFEDDDCSCSSDYSECERVCGQVVLMLEDAGIDTDNHDEMIEQLEYMKLVKKEVKPEYKSVKKTKGKIEKVEKKVEEKKPVIKKRNL